MCVTIAIGVTIAINVAIAVGVTVVITVTVSGSVTVENRIVVRESMITGSVGMGTGAVLVKAAAKCGETHGRDVFYKF